jgi:hypothetical protein
LKYRKKPVVIEAFRFQIDDEMPDWFIKKMKTNDIIACSDGTCIIETSQGLIKVEKGDYIIRDKQGYIYSCNREDFGKMHDPANENKTIETKIAEKIEEYIQNYGKHPLRILVGENVYDQFKQLFQDNLLNGKTAIGPQRREYFDSIEVIFDPTRDADDIVCLEQNRFNYRR